MNNLTPYISSEPPPITNDSFEHESYDSHFYTPYHLSDALSNNMVNDVMEVDQYSGQAMETDLEFFQYHNFGKENDLQGSRNPVELFQYIENIVIENNLIPDVTDSVIHVDQNDDVSTHSLDGEFDDYIDGVYNNEIIEKDSPNAEKQSDEIHNSISDNISSGCIDNPIDLTISKSPTNDDPSDELVEKCADLKVDDFGDFPAITDDHNTNYFSDKNSGESTNSEALHTDFADFSFVNYSHESDFPENFNADIKETCINKEESFNNDFDDDFEDFATFEDCSTVNSTEQLPKEENQRQNADDILKTLLENILENFDSCQSDLSFSNDVVELSRIIRADSFISNQKLFDEIGLVVWKELTNYDYSPAFIFQWMQSATYERFMSSIGPEYKEMLSLHRATLPLYSVNLTPIEPIPLENCLQANASASSSSIDLTSKDESGTGVQERNSNIDFKNLEEEFIFDKFSSVSELKPVDVTSTNLPSISSISSTVIQSERRGGILKSILKPLNSTKTSSINSKSLNPETEAVLKELPDLSYMSSKVLMFPVISACDVEDNI